MHCKVPVLNSIFVIQSKEKKPERDKIKRTLNIKKNQMTTTLTVNSANGTLKQNNSLVTRMMRMTASLLLAVVALATMSFTQDDTTKYAEERMQNADSCCMVTFVSGNQQIMITNINAFAAEVRINNMDLNTWVNSLKAYSFKKFNFNMIGLADQKIDRSFAVAEALSRTMAVSYSRNMQSEMAVADNYLNNTFDKAVAVPLFGKLLQTEVADADMATDRLIADDADNKAKASAYRKSVTSNNIEADEQVDLMLYASAIQNTANISTTEADKNIDVAMYKSVFKTVRPADATSADNYMDALLKSK